MKRVLYVVPGLNPLIKDGASNRVNSYAKCFAQGGYKVNILALCHIKEYFNLYKKRKSLDQSYHWILVPYIFWGNHRISLVMYFYLKPIILFIALMNKCTVVLADYAHGAAMSSWTRLYAKLIANHRGDSIDEMRLNMNLNDNSNYIKCYKSYLTHAVTHSDFSICVSNNLKKEIEQQTNQQINKCFIFPCCADINRFSSVISNTSKEEIVLGYFGSLSKWQCIDEVIDLYSRLKSIDSRYKLLILTASDATTFKKQLDKIGDYQIRSVSFDNMPQFISKMDISIALRVSRPLNIVSSPTKLSESLACGVPVVVTKATGDYADIVIHNENGFVLEDLDISENDLNALHKFCLSIKANKKVISSKCREAVKDRTWNNYSHAFIKFIEQ